MESAEPKGQLRALRNWFCIRLPMSGDLAPTMTSGMTNIPRVEMKTSMEPAAIPGRVSGRVILKNDLSGVAPRSEAAYKRRRSSCYMDT